MTKQKSPRKRAKRLSNKVKQGRVKGLPAGAKSRFAVREPAAPSVSTEQQVYQHRFHIQETLSRFAKLL